jgi:hypothetical protein
MKYMFIFLMGLFNLSNSFAIEPSHCSYNYVKTKATLGFQLESESPTDSASNILEERGYHFTSDQNSAELNILLTSGGTQRPYKCLYITRAPCWEADGVTCKNIFYYCEPESFVHGWNLTALLKRLPDCESLTKTK